MSEYMGKAAHRKEQIKGMILRLHAGEDPMALRREFLELVRGVSPVEISQMEQELIAEGMPAEEVKRLCDVHVAIFQEALDEQAAPEMVPGHPVHTFKYENWALTEVLGLLEEALAPAPEQVDLPRARIFAEQFSEVNKIYSRKENLLFPFLERHGVSGPSKVMWSTHDDIRGQMKAFRAALAAGDVAQAKELLPPLANAVRQMIYKEENILYPTALKMLDESEWVAIRDQSEEIGYCLVRPGDAWQPQAVAAPMATQSYAPEAQAAPAVPPAGSSAQPAAAGGSLIGALTLDTGALTPEQINLIFGGLPLDITFVDETDTVRFYSHSSEGRIFTRTPAAIGRQVQNCHPPKSVHIVNQILDEFRAGERDVAAFWIQMQGMFVHIRYYALRDAGGTYRGCLEVVQDLAPLRALEGERRLLDE